MNNFINDYALIKSNILNPNFKWYGDRDRFFEVVKQTSYPFFLWNGRVYKVLDGQVDYEDTGLTIEEIEKW